MIHKIKLSEKQSKYIFWVLWIIVSCVLVGWSLYESGIRFNFTASMPVGVYKKTSSMPERGALVAVCLDNQLADMAIARSYVASGQCPSGMQPLLKKAAALPGDVILYDDMQGFFINDELWPHSMRQTVDSVGRIMVTAELPHIVPAGTIFTLSDQHDGSFDSRYFGLVTVEQVETFAPLLIFNGKGV